MQLIPIAALEFSA